MDTLVQVLPGWQTTLTWVTGPDLGGKGCAVVCKETQDAGNDELFMALQTLTFGRDTPSAEFPPQVNFEATDGVQLSSGAGSGWDRDWTVKYFASSLSHHPDGTSFRNLRAFGFTERLRILLAEDDDAHQHDETAWSTFTVWDQDPAPEVMAKRKKATFHNDWWEDGVYEFNSCEFRHGLRFKPCNQNSDCDEPLACQSGMCR